MFLAFFVIFFSLIVEKENLRVRAAYKLRGPLMEGCEIQYLYIHSAISPPTFFPLSLSTIPAT